MHLMYELPNDPNRWWDLVWYLPETAVQPVEPGWVDLDGHSCGGMSCENLHGWVLPVGGSPACQDLLRDIVDEVWSADRLGLDYGVSELAKAEYVAFLSARGLEQGDLGLLQQGVYPLATTASALDSLGVASTPVEGAALVVLGPNCD
ncbi:hypothetical protein OR214_02247 [Ralstonia pickettii OR214]|jgi:hypothetical protein|uniref:Uncharacterized protein n=2 Tax=Ralstonia pickettii TaxID=329 RepID=R0CMS4_RALPI|nr:hypothetical protein OR214_02247 [Ralstonia pickettii OR214]